jgi:hypothetical protein
MTTFAPHRTLCANSVGWGVAQFFVGRYHEVDYVTFLRMQASYLNLQEDAKALETLLVRKKMYDEELRRRDEELHEARRVKKIREEEKEIEEREKLRLSLEQQKNENKALDEIKQQLRFGSTVKLRGEVSFTERPYTVKGHFIAQAGATSKKTSGSSSAKTKTQMLNEYNNLSKKDREEMEDQALKNWQKYQMYQYRCDACNQRFTHDHEVCPNCKAEMRK